MKVCIKICLMISIFFFNAGCSDSRPIQTMAYVTAIGLDYQDGHFITHVQVLNFMNVAKSENNVVGKNVPVWIGRGEGKTVTEALNSLTATSQIRLFWGHVRSIVVNEDILKMSDILRESYEGINRYREVRYNILLYATKEPMTEIFKQKSILNLSVLDSILDTPEDTFNQRSFIHPQYGYKFIAELNELGVTAILPTIAITKADWKEDDKKKPMFRVSGAYFLRQNQFKGWFSESDLRGRRWVQKKNKRSLINIPNNKDPKASVVMINPHYRIDHYMEKNQVYYKITIKVKAYVEELIKDFSVKDMEEAAAEVIRNEITTTYQKGLSTQTDLLNLFSELYRTDSKTWHALQQKDQLKLTKDTISKIDVKVKITHTGKYKGKP
ncbi:Ger(x)C family spore germination protein [Paenibacillus sp. N3.4]|uniref:Ger(x)C family spore germination protein n=1 Tax=Paenibacillus sp. N3.4 TaxID=2603222 RepID=UPI0011C7C38F|nr:Ger(x)C family spore germination protein [Paenibacillus sp. N3.4]TXK71943.1 Ger(x)C family spore germination protein [Paenibacillus sp. N3.4]